jgi:hypothetical protein
VAFFKQQKDDTYRLSVALQARLLYPCIRLDQQLLHAPEPNTLMSADVS